MDNVLGSSAAGVAMLEELRKLRMDVAEIDKNIAWLEAHIDELLELENNIVTSHDVTHSLHTWRHFHSQMNILIHTVEHGLNCEIIRSVHLICA